MGSPDAARAQDVVSRWSRRARSWRRDGRSHRGRGARPTTAPVATSTTGGVSPVDAGATDAEGGGETDGQNPGSLPPCLLCLQSFSATLSILSHFPLCLFSLSFSLSHASSSLCPSLSFSLSLSLSLSLSSLHSLCLLSFCLFLPSLERKRREEERVRE